MKIHRLSATFGRLGQETLELRDGLNILQAPNETGKSTWCAFLAAMLYGVNSRERDKAGFIADKNRFAPWSGAAMAGRLDCRVGSDELRITRETRRQNAPMGEFTAVYAGTGDSVPGLSGQTCGETLLGISREVFERSAFIRQAGLPITQDAGLERRIAALITTGEEGTSYSEAADTLKKQLNRRRHNKTGLLPDVEAELAEIRRQLQELAALETEWNGVEEEIASLRRQEETLSAELALHDRWEAAQLQNSLESARLAAQEAEQAAKIQRSRLEQEGVPENDGLARLRGAIVNLETVRRGVDKAREARDEALKEVLRADAAVNESVFAGHSPEDARREAAAQPKVQSPLLLPCLISAGLLLLSGLAGYFLKMPLVAYIGFAMTVFLCWRLCVTAKAKAQCAALEKRFGTTDRAEIAAKAEDYIQKLEAREAAQSAAAGKSAVADSLYASLSSNEQAILLEVRRFAPAAFDIPAADVALRDCAVRRKTLAEMEADAREKRVRYEAQSENAIPYYNVEKPAVQPEQSRATVTAALENARTARASARSTADHLSGRIHAIGDRVVLQSQAKRLEEQSEALEGECRAIALAMDALSGANTALQNRFSPALGQRSAEIFGLLTQGRYTGVVLDRSFHLSAEPAGDVVDRDAGLLSAGAADQLYLATRLAICDLVLPQGGEVPMILDDALANFDDARCAAALQYLKKMAQTRQILLFTCHSREAAFFRGDDEVSIQVLTGEREKV